MSLVPIRFIVYILLPSLIIAFYSRNYNHKNTKFHNHNLVLNSQHAAYYKEIIVSSLKGIHFADITKQVQQIVDESGVKEGQINVLSRHTTTAITINEMEGRLVDDARQYLLKLAPAAYPYLHNDLHLRNGPPGWPGGDEAWRAQEPINAHSHLLTMLLGTSETVPVHQGKLMLGKWQSLIMVELDGPRNRTVAVQITGLTA